VLEEFGAAKPEVDWDGDVQIVALSADDSDDLTRQLGSFDGLADWFEIRSAAWRSRRAFQPALRWRLLLVVRRGQAELGALITAARKRLNSTRQAGSSVGISSGSVSVNSEAAGVFLGVAAPRGKLALLFPGQGSQYVGMLRDLACRFPRMLESLALSNEFSGPADVPLSNVIYPQSAFTEGERREHEQALRETEAAQRAIGAVSLGLLQILEDFGVSADLVGGHSFGELTALRAAGRLDDRSLAMLAAQRGRLMAGAARSEEAGAMVAVFAPLDEVRVVLQEHALDLVIANKNAPRQCVLSGPAAEIQRSAQVFATRNIATRPIGVSRAFHSRLVASAEGSFRSVLDSIPFTPTSIPVFANTTALPYPADPGAARAVLAGQLARPVEFVSQIEAMYRMGAHTFLEVGPDSKLTALVRAILEGRDHVAIAVDASRGGAGNVYDLACALASLAVQGHGVDLTRWDSKPQAAHPNRPGLTVKVCGANARPKETMNPTEGTKAHHANGQVSSHDLAGLKTVKHILPPASSQPLFESAPPAGIAGALQNARENLLALQRLAEQTAALHRQFLEGQDKTQQAFMKLLDHEQRLSWALLGSPGARTGLSHEQSPAAAQPESVRAPSIAAAPYIEPAPRRDLPIEKLEPQSLDVKLEALEQDAPREPVAPTASAHPVSPASNGSLTGIVVEVVSEKTGYPAEVLDLDMQLDADLGIDSIKRVEILSALQERLPALPSIRPELLGTSRSLREIVENLSDARTTAPETVPEQKSAETTRPADASAEIARVLVETVAEKTGYPAEMLELDMRLDADLGIDSIKRVEIFSAIQERMPSARAAGPEEIGTLGTLREIVAFLGRSADARPEPARRPATAYAPALPAGEPITRVSLDSVAEKTGSPIDLLELGIDTNGAAAAGPLVLSKLYPRARAFELPDRREAVSLRAGGMVWITDDGSPLALALERRLVERGIAARVIQLDQAVPPAANERLCGLIVLAPRDAIDHAFVTRAFRVMRGAAPALEESAARGGASFATVSRLDGSFGLNGLSGAASPISGALAAFAKTAGREWPAVECKAIDLDAVFDVPEGAARLIVEEFLKRGPDEVGINRHGRTVIDLDASMPSALARRRGMDLGRGDLVVISGGGRGITAEVALAIASAFQPRLVILGRSPAPGPEEEWLAAIHDEPSLKRALTARANRRLTPQELNQESRRLFAEREVRRNLERISSTGSPVIYQSVDVRDRDALRSALTRIRHQHGPVRGLVHGAGVLADRRIVDQTDAQFDLVYETKALGLEHLFEAIDPESLTLLVLFSSSSARFGRAGQVAYAAANEFLNKWAEQQASRLPSCRVISFNWGPWAGGMVTDALKPLFEQEGHSLIPLEAGAKLVVDESRQAGARPVEVVVAAEPRRADAPAPKKARRGFRGARSRRFAGCLSPRRGSRVVPGTGRPRHRWASGVAGRDDPGMDGRGCARSQPGPFGLRCR
jgi:malonyl CoA-acyl carrier protein transacylase/NAD(P)-dependent dehydrogenase (short-subunit alcohol dehydrogenase family)